MKKVGIIIGVVALLLAIVGAVLYIWNNNTPTITEDSKKFKEEYESYNDVLNENAGRNYLAIDIKEYNPFKYSSYDEIFEVLENGTGIIYFGFPTCPWCRNLVPILSDAAIDSKYKEILYLNILDDRDIKELKTEGKGKKATEVVTTTKEANENYVKLLNILDEVTPVYKGLNDDTIKRIYLPTVVFVKNGKVIGYEQSLKAFSERVAEEEGGAYLPMNTEEQNALKKIFTDYITELKK